MKKITLLTVFICLIVACDAQFYSKYGDTINIGDKLIIGKASNQLGFDFITQGMQRMHPSHAGKEIIVTDIKEVEKKNDKKTYVVFKGFGLIPVFLDYDNAIDCGEIINKAAKFTRQNAIEKLKEAKVLLDLGVISQQKYDSLKLVLTPYIND